MCSTPFGIIGRLTAQLLNTASAFACGALVHASVPIAFNRRINSKILPDFISITPGKFNHFHPTQASHAQLTSPNPSHSPHFPTTTLAPPANTHTFLRPHAKSNGRPVSNHDSGRLCSPTCRSQLSHKLKINSRSSSASNISSNSHRNFSICNRDSGRLCSPTCRSQLSHKLKINSRSSSASNISSNSHRNFSICNRVKRQRNTEYCKRLPYPLSFLYTFRQRFGSVMS